MNRDTARDLVVFGLLLAIGVVGRWYQPAWNFTPLVAVTALGGYYFRQLMPALLLPVGVLAVSDLILPSHDSLFVMISVHLMMIIPLLMGRHLKNAQGWRSAAGWAMCGFLPATCFYLVTNFAVWAFKSDYPNTFAGLMSCYAAGVPFYRWMLVGDAFYLALLVGSLFAARAALGEKSKALEV